MERGYYSYQLSPSSTPVTSVTHTTTNGNIPNADSTEEHEHHRVDFNTATHLRVAAIAVSWVSVIFSLTSGIASIVLGSIERSESLFGYGLDAVLDSISSIVVLWRFYGTSTTVYSPSRERVACIVVDVLFYLAAICLIGKSVYALSSEIREEQSDLQFVLAIVNGVLSLLLAVVKVTLGYKLESKVLVIDSVITFTGSAFSFANLGSLIAYENDHRLWYMDSIFGIVCGVFLLAFGIKITVDLVYYRKYRPEKKSLLHHAANGTASHHG